MPPKTRKTGAATRSNASRAAAAKSSATANSQSRLTFRATKHAAPAGKDVKEPPAKKARTSDVSDTSDVAVIELDEREQSVTDEVATKGRAQTNARAEIEVNAPAAEEQAEDEVEEVAQEEEEEEEEEYLHQARTMKDAQIKKYWSAKEEARLAPRVHQKDLSLWEKVLREFDVTSRFGPSIGISRTKRWVRAWELGMEPPLEVLAVLLKSEDGGAGKKSGAAAGVGERSIVDELMSSRLGSGKDGVVDA